MFISESNSSASWHEVVEFGLSHPPARREVLPTLSPWHLLTSDIIHAGSNDQIDHLNDNEIEIQSSPESRPDGAHLVSRWYVPVILQVPRNRGVVLSNIILFMTTRQLNSRNGVSSDYHYPHFCTEEAKFFSFHFLMFRHISCFHVVDCIFKALSLTAFIFLFYRDIACYLSMPLRSSST